MRFERNHRLGLLAAAIAASGPGTMAATPESDANRAPASAHQVQGRSLAALGEGCLPDADGDGHPLFGNPEFVSGEVSCSPPGIACNEWSGRPRSVALGDVNGDQIVDLAAANYGATPFNSSVSVYIGIGDGTYQEQALYEVEVNPIAVEIADMNGDGASDLVVLNSHTAGFADEIPATVSVLLNVGDGTFGPQAVSAPLAIEGQAALGEDLEVADVNGDCHPDAVAVTRHAIYVLTNDGAGALTLGPNAVVGTGSFRSVAVADLDGDGLLDIAGAISSGLGGSVELYRNEGNGTFGLAEVLGLTGFTTRSGLALADADGDGDPDLAVTTGVAFTFDSRVMVWRNDGPFSFALSQSLPPYSDGVDLGDVAFADLTGDGLPELLVTVNGSSTDSRNDIDVFVNIGAGLFAAEPERFGAGHAPTQVAAADIDGDGDVDVAASSRVEAFGGTRTFVSVLLNDGAGSLLSDDQLEVGQGASDCAIIDLNGDQLPEIVTSNALSEDCSVLFNQGGGVFAQDVRVPLTFDAPPRYSPLDGGDINGDGDPDLVVARSLRDGEPFHNLAEVVVLTNTDGTLVAGPPELFAQRAMRGLRVADVDGNGMSDVILFGRSDGDSLTIGPGFTVLLRDENGWASGGTAYHLREMSLGAFEGGQPAEALTAADLDGDGDLDIAALAPDNSIAGAAVLVARNDGGGMFEFWQVVFWPPVEGAINLEPASIEAADLDGDGDVDLAVSVSERLPHVGVPRDEGRTPGRLGVCLNDGSGTLSTPVPYRLSTGGCSGATTLAIEDFDGDGVPDVAIGNWCTSNVGVSLGAGDGTFAPDMPYGVGFSGGSIAAGDLDGDERPDIVKVNGAWDNVSVLWNRSCGALPGCAGDVNGDGATDSADLSILIGAFGSAVPPGTSGDVNGDGVVDAADLSVVVGDFGCGVE